MAVKSDSFAGVCVELIQNRRDNCVCARVYGCYRVRSGDGVVCEGGTPSDILINILTNGECDEVVVVRSCAIRVVARTRPDIR